MAGGPALLLEEEEEHENHERYLITYADMITLLLALFIILFAISQVDLEKYKEFGTGLASAFGNPTFDGGDGLLPARRSGPPPQAPSVTLPVTVAEPAEGFGPHIERGEAEAFAGVLEEALASLGLPTLDELGPDAEVVVRVEARGIVVVLDTDEVTFASGSWALSPAGTGFLDALFGPLAAVDNRVLIEGHTDDRPMTGGMTNWELSANRAGAVVRYLIDQRGIDPHRLAAAGYSDTRPIADNGTAEGRQANRRVEIVLAVDTPGQADEAPEG